MWLRSVFVSVAVSGEVSLFVSVWARVSPGLSPTPASAAGDGHHTRLRQLQERLLGRAFTSAAESELPGEGASTDLKVPLFFWNKKQVQLHVISPVFIGSIGALVDKSFFFAVGFCCFLRYVYGTLFHIFLFSKCFGSWQKKGAALSCIY